MTERISNPKPEHILAPQHKHISMTGIRNLDPGRDPGILTEEQRRFLLGEGDDDLSEEARYHRYYRMRNKFRDAFRDLYYFSLLREEHREWVFSEVMEDREVPDGGHDLMATVFQELYTGLNRAAFEMALEDGVEAAIVQSRVNEEGVYPDIDPRLEIEEGDFGDFDVEEILSRIREGDGWLHVDREHVERLYDAGVISHAEFSELRDETRRVLSDEEQRLFELEREEEQLEAAKIWKSYEDGWSVNDVLFLRDQDYLSSEEANAILDGGHNHDGLRYIAHCLRCAYESDDWERPFPRAGLLPESAADVKITRDFYQELLDKLSEWHREEKVPQEQVEAIQRGKGEDDMALLSRCSDFEDPVKSPSAMGEDLSMPMLTPDFEPKHDPEEFPSPDELTPTHIEALYQDRLLSEDRYHELLGDRLEVAPDLLTDEQVRSLFAAGEIGINEVRSVLDPKDIDEEYIVDIYQKERIDQKQYLDMLEMKYQQGGSMAVSEDRVRELLEEDRISPQSAHVSSSQLHDLYKMQEITPRQYLDILHTRFDENPGLLNQEDLLYLYEDERITREDYMSSDQTGSRESLENSLLPAEKRISLVDLHEMTEEELEEARREKEDARLDLILSDE